MNEKIKELAYRIKLLDDDGWNTSNLNRDVEKFAELIIKETLSIVKDEVQCQMDNDMANYIADLVHRRFAMTYILE